jgi:hypothetical protein
LKINARGTGTSIGLLCLQTARSGGLSSLVSSTTIGARPLPNVYAERFGSITPGDRGGVTTPGSRPTIPFD